MVPNITSTKLSWNTEDIVEYLLSGFTPDFDVAGGHMVDVIENTSKLTDEDRLAIAQYLKAIPGVQK
jgi:adenine specific DNA methylase Mod